MLIRGNLKDISDQKRLPRVPIAGIIHSASNSIPDNFLICNGAAISRTTYSTLFTSIGTTWGAGDGSTTFNIPDFRGRIPVGAGVKSLASSGASTTLFTGKWSATLTHNAHIHVVTDWPNTSGTTTPGTHTISGTDSENLPHYIAVNVLVRYGKTKINTTRGLVIGSSINNKYLEDNIPSSIGSICLYASNSIPDNFLICNGAAISRTTYSTLFTSIGTTWGAGDGSTTFNIPDFNNYFLAGYTTGGPYTNRNTINLGPKTKAPTNAISFSAHVEHTHTHPTRVSSAGRSSSSQFGSPYPILQGNFSLATETHGHTISGGDTETVPNNVCGQYMIRYK